MSEELQNNRLNTFLNERIVQTFTMQYFHELDNAFIYQFFSTWAHTKGFPGAKKWFNHQYKEELKHANSIRDFLSDAGIYFSLETLPLTNIEINNYGDLFKEALLRETKTTDKINEIMSICATEKQFLAQEFMNRLLYNQLSEEEEARMRYQISLNTTDNILADHQIGDL